MRKFIIIIIGAVLLLAGGSPAQQYPSTYRGPRPATKAELTALEARLDSLLEVNADTSITNTLAALIDSLATASADQDSVLQAMNERDSTRIDSISALITPGDIWLSSLTMPDSAGHGEKDSLIIGETVGFANALYMKSDGKLWKADNDTSITLPARYIALESGSANDTIVVLVSGKIKCSGWTFTAGQWLIVSNTAGELKATAVASGEWQQYVGVIGPVDVLEWHPDVLPVLKK